MKLKDKNATPVGGFFYDDPVTDRRISTSGSFRTLVKTVRDIQSARGYEVQNLDIIIEDQICSRQPAGKCFFTRGLGDIIANVIHTTAGAIDKVAGTQLAVKAKKCKSCGKRREALNRLTSR